MTPHAQSALHLFGNKRLPAFVCDQPRIPSHFIPS